MSRLTNAWGDDDDDDDNDNAERSNTPAASGLDHVRPVDDRKLRSNKNNNTQNRRPQIFKNNNDDNDDSISASEIDISVVDSNSDISQKHTAKELSKNNGQGRPSTWSMVVRQNVQPTQLQYSIPQTSTHQTTYRQFDHTLIRPSYTFHITAAMRDITNYLRTDIRRILLSFAEILYLSKLEKAAGELIDTDVTELNGWLLRTTLYLHVNATYDKFEKPISGMMPDNITDAEIEELLKKAGINNTKLYSSKIDSSKIDSSKMCRVLFYIYRYRNKIEKSQSLMGMCKPVWDLITGTDNQMSIKNSIKKYVNNLFERVLNEFEQHKDWQQIIDAMVIEGKKEGLTISKATQDMETNNILAIIRVIDDTTYTADRMVLYKYKDNRKFTRITEQARCCATEYTDDKIHITTNDIIIYRNPEEIEKCKISSGEDISLQLCVLNTSTPVLNHFRLLAVLIGYVDRDNGGYTHCKFLNRILNWRNTFARIRKGIEHNDILSAYFIKMLPTYIYKIARAILTKKKEYSEAYKDDGADDTKYIAGKHLLCIPNILSVLYKMGIHKQLLYAPWMTANPTWLGPIFDIKVDLYTFNKLKSTIIKILPSVLPKINAKVLIDTKQFVKECIGDTPKTQLYTSAKEFHDYMQCNPEYRKMSIQAYNTMPALMPNVPEDHRALHRLLYEYTKALLRDKLNNPVDAITDPSIFENHENGVYSTTVAWCDKQSAGICKKIRRLTKLKSWPTMSGALWKKLCDRRDKSWAIPDGPRLATIPGLSETLKNYRDTLKSIYDTIGAAHTYANERRDIELPRNNIIQQYKLLYKCSHKLEKLEFAKIREQTQLEQLNTILSMYNTPHRHTSTETSNMHKYMKNQLENHWLLEKPTHTPKPIHKKYGRKKQTNVPKIDAKQQAIRDARKQYMQEMLKLLSGSTPLPKSDISTLTSKIQTVINAINNAITEHTTTKQRIETTILNDTSNLFSYEHYNTIKLLINGCGKKLLGILEEIKKRHQTALDTIRSVKDDIITQLNTQNNISANTQSAPNACITQIVNTPIANCMCVIPDEDLIGAIFPKAYIQKLKVTDIVNGINDQKSVDYKHMIRDFKNMIITDNKGIVGFLQFPYNTVIILTVLHTIRNTTRRQIDSKHNAANGPIDYNDNGTSNTTHRYIATSNRDKPGFKLWSTPQKEVPSFSKLLHAALAPMRIGESADSNTLTSTWQSATLKEITIAILPV